MGRLFFVLGAAVAIWLVPRGFSHAGSLAVDADANALRHDLPVLAAHFVPGAKVAVTGVAVAGDDALVAWSWSDPSIKDVKNTWMGTSTMSTTFRRHGDRWWLVQNFGSFGPALGITTEQIAFTLHVSDATARTFERLVPQLAGAELIERNPEPFACAACLSTLYDTGEFDATFSYDMRAASPGLSVAFKRQLPEDERALYAFALTSNATAPLSVAVARVSVWFPYVLDPSKHYMLSLGSSTPAQRDVPGRIENNTLTFSMESFALAPRPALGTITEL